MKNNKGITMIALVITTMMLIILAGITIGTGSKMIEESELENLITNMLLIKGKGKEYIENANFKLGTSIDTATDKETRITNAKQELRGEEIIDSSIFNENLKITQDKITTDNANYIYYYKLTTQNLIDMGLSNVTSNQKYGWYIVKYDIKNLEIEVYNTDGFSHNGTIYFALSELQNIDT